MVIDTAEKVLEYFSLVKKNDRRDDCISLKNDHLYCHVLPGIVLNNLIFFNIGQVEYQIGKYSRKTCALAIKRCEVINLITIKTKIDFVEKKNAHQCQPWY